MTRSFDPSQSGRPRGVRRWFRINAGPGAVGREVDRELRAHIDLTIEELIASGMTRDAAVQAAHTMFGDYGAVAAECSQVRLTRTRRRQWSETMSGIFQDVRFAFRTLIREPVFALVAIATLALGIGTNAAVFSAVRAILLKPLPFAEPDRVVAISLPRGQSFSKRRLQAIRQRQTTFESIAAYSRWGASLTGDGAPAVLRGAVGTADLFTVLGAKPELGRAFLPGEDRAGNDGIVILSHELWNSRYGSDPSIVGRVLKLNGEPRTVVGIMPAGFGFPISRAEFWAPTVIDSAAGDYSAGYLLLVGRVKRGVSVARANEDIKRVIATLRADKLGGFTAEDEAGLAVAPVRDLLVGKLGRMLILLWGAVAFILSIACVNVANLLLVRSSSRQREFAVRAAIGAGRGRLLRQMLTESILLSAIGAAVGIFSALGLARAISGLLPADVIGANAVRVDSRVLAFSALLSIVVGIAFGLVPAFRGARDDLLTTLRGGQGADSREGHRTMNSLVIGEFALASVLAIGAALTVQSFWRLRAEDPGFRSAGLVELRIEPPQASYATPESQRALISGLTERFRAVPGVSDVGAIHLLPLGDGNWNPELVIEGRAANKEGRRPEVDWRIATPGYFRTMNIPVLRGRSFTEADGADALSVALVNDALARRDFPGEDPIGKRVRTFFEGKGNWTTIIGVVGNTKDQTLAGSPRPQMYRPLAQNPFAGMTFLVRTSLPMGTIAPSLREAVWSIDRNIPIADIRAMDEVVAASIGQPRMMALLLGSFGALGLVLGAIGIYGVTSYVVARRTSELGLRMALGARGNDVLRMVILDASRLAAIGIGLGLAASYWLARLLRAQLYGVQPTDLGTFAMVGVALCVVGLVAAAVPAWRASRIDPLVALRSS